MVDTPDLTARVDGMESIPSGVRVHVNVAGPSFAPDFTRSIRARARALIAAGVLPTTVDTVEDVTMGQLKRLTNEVGGPTVQESGRMTKTTSHTVNVNRD